MTDIGEYNKSFLNLLFQKTSGKENPETLEEVSEKQGINWNDFLEVENSDDRCFALGDFKRAVNEAVKKTE